MTDDKPQKSKQKVKTEETSPEQKSGQEFQEKVARISEKVGDAVKKGSERVAKFTGSATRLSRLKMEIHNLRNQLHKVHLESGKKLWQMHQENKLSEIDTAFSEEFAQIADLEKQIRTKEKEAEAISLVE